MTGYTFLNEAEAQEHFDRFPKINAAKLTRQVNELFTPYLFFRREKDTIALWCSRCLWHGNMDNPPRFIGKKEKMIIFGKHDDKVVCPHCGKDVTMKNVSRLGKKKKLREFHPVIFLSAKRGDLYARCYWTRKDYQGNLDDPPLFKDTHAMHFSIGRTEDFHEEWVGYDQTAIKRTVLEGNYDPVHRVITEPFVQGSNWSGYVYCSYYVFGLEAIARSDFKYCQYEHYEYDKCDSAKRPLCNDLCKYLAAYSIYPRQIEMLMKTGGELLVADLVSGRRKNRNVIDWNATNPCDAFGLDKAELRAFRESGCDIHLIGEYKKLRKHKLPTSFASLHEMEGMLDDSTTEEIVKTCVARKIHPDKLRRYIDRFTGPRGYGGMYTFTMAWRDWKDYTVMAEKLDYDLTVETVLMPRNLDLAHNEAQRELYLREVREAREAEKQRTEKEKDSLAQRQRKYNIEYGGYFIRIAESAAEITAEGKALVHCVGGYAERHMNGNTTILFLRSSKAPDVPLYTIQMDGNSLIQIHGYKNERLAGAKRTPDPRETMRWILDPWLEWLNKGSPRRKDGTARLPELKEVKTA